MYDPVSCDWSLPVAHCPTAAPAGSRHKLRVLTDRAERGLPLFHPLDNHHLERNPRQRGGRAKGTKLPAGVTRDRRTGCYRARVWLPGERKLQHVGTFRTAAEAEAAVSAAKQNAALQGPHSGPSRMTQEPR